ncbi:MAG: hypothetical protein KAS32_20360, partial [Candidatus Peribacteraceae bacterium]|nr:hypothetical protein [Candidatus Peribacteraceae bacterium]
KKEEIESAISPKKICDVEIIGKSKIGLITEDWYRLKPDAELKLHEVVMLLKLADMKFVANIVNSHMPTPLAEKFEKVGEIADLYADQQEAPNDTVKA